MIVKETWPNYKGVDKDGVAVIIDHNSFSSDVKYGRTKLFIRTPKTVFELEKIRAQVLPNLVLFLQKVRLSKAIFLRPTGPKNGRGCLRVLPPTPSLLKKNKIRTGYIENDRSCWKWNVSLFSKFNQNPSLPCVPFRIKLILRMHWLGHPGLSNRTEAP